MNKDTYTPLTIEGKIYVVVDAPNLVNETKEKVRIRSVAEWKELVDACTKYPTLEQDAPYWKERIGQQVEVEIKEVWCHANKDCGCRYKDCPQLRDNEPETTGRSCPLDHLDYDEEPKMYAVIPGTHILDYKTAIPQQQKQDDGDLWDEADAEFRVKHPNHYKMRHEEYLLQRHYFFMNNFHLTRK